MSIQFVNLTPHRITVRQPHGDLIIEPSGKIARLRTMQVVFTPWGDDMPPLAVTELMAIEDLPDPQPGVVYVVSSLVAQAAARYRRRDVVAPDTGRESAIRDETGQIVAVRRFQMFK